MDCVLWCLDFLEGDLEMCTLLRMVILEGVGLMILSMEEEPWADFRLMGKMVPMVHHFSLRGASLWSY